MLVRIGAIFGQAFLLKTLSRLKSTLEYKPDLKHYNDSFVIIFLHFGCLQFVPRSLLSPLCPAWLSPFLLGSLDPLVIMDEARPFPSVARMLFSKGVGPYRDNFDRDACQRRPREHLRAS